MSKYPVYRQTKSEYLLSGPCDEMNHRRYRFFTEEEKLWYHYVSMCGTLNLCCAFAPKEWQIKSLFGITLAGQYQVFASEKIAEKVVANHMKSLREKIDHTEEISS